MFARIDDQRRYISKLVQENQELEEKLRTANERIHALLCDRSRPNPDWVTPPAGTHVSTAAVGGCMFHGDRLIAGCPKCDEVMNLIRAPKGQRWAAPPAFEAGMWIVSYETT
jgi:hypothetical protein